MSIPNEALQKLALEIEAQAVSAQREIDIVKDAVASKQRDVRMLELTGGEVRGLAAGTKVYEGVGKMFVWKATADVEERLSLETGELKSDISNLGKKLHYLETTYKNSRDHIDKIVNSGGRS